MSPFIINNSNQFDYPSIVECGGFSDSIKDVSASEKYISVVSPKENRYQQNKN